MTLAPTPPLAIALGRNLFDPVFPCFRVTGYRSSHKASIGDGGDAQLLLRTRQHGNSVKRTSFVLIFMVLAEGTGAPSLYLHISGAVLLLGRVEHPFGLRIDDAGHVPRHVGKGSNRLGLMACLDVNLAGI